MRGGLPWQLPLKCCHCWPTYGQFTIPKAQRPTTGDNPTTCHGAVAGCCRDQNAEVELGSTSAAGNWVTGPVSIEMWSMIFAGTTIMYMYTTSCRSFFGPALPLRFAFVCQVFDSMANLLH